MERAEVMRRLLAYERTANEYTLEVAHRMRPYLDEDSVIRILGGPCDTAEARDARCVNDAERGVLYLASGAQWLGTHRLSRAAEEVGDIPPADLLAVSRELMREARAEREATAKRQEAGGGRGSVETIFEATREGPLERGSSGT